MEAKRSATARRAGRGGEMKQRENVHFAQTDELGGRYGGSSGGERLLEVLRIDEGLKRVGG